MASSNLMINYQCDTVEQYTDKPANTMQYDIKKYFFHSFEYTLAVALICSLLEYMVEIALFPGLKDNWWISGLGVALVITGELIQKMAIITATNAFTHLIRIYLDENHRLITHGIYRMRNMLDE